VGNADPSEAPAAAIRRFCYALDLIDDAALIAEYEARHAPGSAWPEVVAHIRAQGAEHMEIWRAGDRLMMIVEAANDYPRPVPAPPEIDRWEELMWRFQRPLPFAPAGEKWMQMTQIFDLDAQ
jgi:L-rhamnose mutarotase